MRRVRLIGKYLLRSALALAGAVLLYMLTALGLSKITVNKDFAEAKTDSLYIYIITNGIHTDIAMPVKNHLKNWEEFVDPKNTNAGAHAFSYVGFGYGDREFYINTPEWSDLKFKTGIKALFIPSSAAMHVTFYNSISESKDCKKIAISKTEYELIAAYIKTSFKTENDKPIIISGVSYRSNDLFCEANGIFHLFFTCNTWTNKALKSAGMKACLWTPFGREILNKY